MKSKKFPKIFKKIWRKKIIRQIIIGSGFFVLFLAVIFFSFSLVFQDKILPRTFIGATNFGGQNRAQAQETLEKLILSSQGQELNFVFLEKSYNLNPAALAVDYQKFAKETLDQLFDLGRVGDLGEIMKETIRSIFAKNDIYAYFELNDNQLNDYLLGIAKDIDKPEKDARIEIRNFEPVVTKEEIGQRFETLENRKIVLKKVGSFSLAEPMPFIIEQILPKIDTFNAEKAMGETRELLSRQLVLRAASKTFQIYPQDVAEMLEFVARLDQNAFKENNARSVVYPYRLSPEISAVKVHLMVEKIAVEIYQEPKDPKFKASGNRVVAFQLAQTGYELEKEKSVSQIIDGLKNDERSLDLPVKVTESQIADDNPVKLGLKEIVAEGTTNFSGSPQNRRHNIAVGGQAFDGVLIKPGEEFSMLKYLGPVEASTGYLPELVIKEDRTIPEYGGGLCQVSTTMFRAALNGGLKITERQNHSYRVRYYEPPVGMDATIYIPKPDFKFVNDYQSYLLIQTIISGDNLTFRFYGTKDGRRSETTDPYVYDVIGAGEPIYTESPDLAPGEIKRTETAHPGSKASFKYSVFDKDNKLMHQETFNSSYVPWPARYLYGPGTTIPPPEE